MTASAVVRQACQAPLSSEEACAYRSRHVKVLYEGLTKSIRDQRVQIGDTEH